jgi:polyhydroxyalkanoate synthase
VDLQKISMPVLNFYGKYDHLVPPEACELLTRNVGSQDTEDVCLDTGHIGIYVSSKCQKEFAPKIARWLKDRDKVAEDGPEKDVPVMKTTSKRIGRKSTPASRKTKSASAESKESVHA